MDGAERGLDGVKAPTPGTNKTKRTEGKASTERSATGRNATRRGETERGEASAQNEMKENSTDFFKTIRKYAFKKKRATKNIANFAVYYIVTAI